MAQAIGAKYRAGDRVRVRVDSPPRHIRTPAYIMGKVGRVESLLGAYPNPESLAYGSDGLPALPLYHVAFAQTDVWDGYDGSPADRLEVDIFEHWLEPA